MGLLLQSCPTLCYPIDSSPPGSTVPGILQARTLEWVVISFSNAQKWKVKVKSPSHVRLFATPWAAAYHAPRPWDFPGKSTGVGCHCLLPRPSLKCNYPAYHMHLCRFPWLPPSFSLSVPFLFWLPFPVRTKVKHHHMAIDVRLPVWLLRAHMI